MWFKPILTNSTLGKVFSSVIYRKSVLYQESAMLMSLWALETQLEKVFLSVCVSYTASTVLIYDVCFQLLLLLKGMFASLDHTRLQNLKATLALHKIKNNRQAYIFKEFMWDMAHGIKHTFGKTLYKNYVSFKGP